LNHLAAWIINNRSVSKYLCKSSDGV
jgi:hypothetical protein